MKKGYTETQGEYYARRGVPYVGKRANEYGPEPWYPRDEDVKPIKLPYKLQGAIWRTPKAPYQQRREDYQNRARPFGNPKHPGYGGGEWPFDVQRAYTNQYYRNGIRKTIATGWADGHWTYVARNKLQDIVDDLLAVEMMAEELDNE